MGPLILKFDMNSDQDKATAFTPKEDLIVALCSLGISRNTAIRGLYHTGNCNADLAAAWIFENPDKITDTPFNEDDEATLVANSSEDLSSISTYKMVFVVNGELNMKVGKVAGQVGHGAVGLYRQLLEDQQQFGDMLLFWNQFGETKIVLKGKNASHLCELKSKADALGLPTFCVHDAGRTEVTPGSLTVLAIMGQNDVINKVTGSLSLL